MNRKLALRVGQSGLIRLQFYKDLPDGNLFIAEAGRQVPFAIKRVYFINTLANHDAVRGKHAHRALEQAIFCISGSFTLQLDDGRVKQRILMNDPACGVRIGPMLWHTMSGFSYDCVILVLASDVFAEADYIRDYDTFLAAAQPRSRRTRTPAVKA